MINIHKLRQDIEFNKDYLDDKQRQMNEIWLGHDQTYRIICGIVIVTTMFVPLTMLVLYYLAFLVGCTYYSAKRNEFLQQYGIYEQAKAYEQETGIKVTGLPWN